MSESGFKVDPSSVNALKDPKKRLTNSMVAKSAREKRRKIIADKKTKRCQNSESNLVSPIKESIGTHIAREKRRRIIAAKKAIRSRCTTSNPVFSNNIQSSQHTKTKVHKNSRSIGGKLQYDISEVLEQKPQAENRPTNAKKK
ncbi:unnamed protein product [Arabidopsis lyrata]|nr:unnamed protein product [Arabidopsis lyrata]